MAYLAPSAELRRHSTDVIVTETATTISFRRRRWPSSAWLPAPLRRRLHPRAGAAPARRARGAWPTRDGFCESRRRRRPRDAAVRSFHCRRDGSVFQSAAALLPSAQETTRKKLITVAALSAFAFIALAYAADAAKAPSAQQNKMTECNKEAGDKKGDDRKAFMKTCLSAKKASQQGR